MPFLEISETALNLDYLGRPYPDLARLTAATLDDIGEHMVTIKVYQDIADADDGFTTPYRGVVPEMEYDITVTIHPCDVTVLQSSTT